MDSSDGVLVDPSKFGKMNLDEKRDFVYQLSKWSHGASDLLQLWSRQEILQILCAEMGKERKYTGLTKLKMIEHLLKIVSGKSSGESEATRNPDQQSEQRFSKRQRKAENPSHVSVPSTSSVPVNASADDLDKSTYCKNTACKANLSKEDAFCKRCSCCICHKYDDNKDPSLWLTCSSEPPFEGISCGMSCHLECALKNVKSCIAKDGDRARNDGCFCCVSCRKINDMLQCWRKQLLMAKETRRVDILCYRLALTKKLIEGTEKYTMLYEIVEDAVKMLESEVGPLSVVPVKMGRGIVNRLSSGQATQKLCSSALEMLDSMISTSTAAPPLVSTAQDSNLISPNMVRFDDVNPTSLTMNLGSINTPLGSSIRYSLWHRSSDEADYASEPTSTLSHPHFRFVFLGLTPSTEYFFRVVCFDGSRELTRFEVRSSTSFLVDEGSNGERSQSPVVTNSSSLSNPSSVEDETNNLGRTEKLAEEETLARPVILSCPDPETNLLDDQVNEETSMGDGSGKECVPFVGATQPITPCKLENWAGRASNGANRVANGSGQDGSSSKKGIDGLDGNSDRDFEFYVKLIRWLECEGHIEKNFRQKFLTWYSLRATPQEVRIVKVYVDTFLEDPASLAEQLVDTFSDKISNKSLSASVTVGPPGMCMKLWH